MNNLKKSNNKKIKFKKNLFVQIKNKKFKQKRIVVIHKHKFSFLKYDIILMKAIVFALLAIALTNAVFVKRSNDPNKAVFA